MWARYRSSLASFALGLVICVPVAGDLWAQTQPSELPSRPPSISTSARGEAKVTADRATINIGVETRAPTAAAAGAENATRSRKVIDALKGAGIPAAQIRTVGYNVHPEYALDRGEQSRRLTGYRVSNAVHVEIAQIDRVGPILDAALAAGANSINSIQFRASNVEVARREAMTRAVELARLEAETLARAAGGSLGRLLNLTSVRGEIPGPPRPLMMERAAMVAAASTPIEPGEHSVWATVTAHWEFVPDRR